MGSLQPKAEGSAETEAESSATFEQTVTVTRHHLILSYKFRIDKREYQQ